MKTLLRIDSSIRVVDSYTRALTDHYEAAWLAHHPEGKVIRRCLATDAIPHLTEQTVMGFSQSSDSSGVDSLSDRLIAELKSADHLLIGSPLYNLSLSSSLKAYFDHIVRSGATFEVKEGCYQGLLQKIGATLVTARSSVSSPDDTSDFQTRYITALLNFIGIRDIDVVAVEATSANNDDGRQRLMRAKQTLDDLFNKPQALAWIGSFSDNDKAEITRIRSAQAHAIIEGNAEHYATLCTDDIQLLIPSHDPISGINAFVKAEQELFENTVFSRFIKFPIRIEKSGNLAVEVGTQEVLVEGPLNAQGVFASRQKYSHVYKKTSEGWRYSVLMSNQCE
ncbi:NAD(P)H-dependent oxidoreductase [Sessilibacter corallicola]|uniref:NAD(P)H-dependent oxidoreductase n=1 Tax=Sessilibacter corallicola TaxID=2904075 RepID=UPI001E28D934|nr:NAD(P)H-dependent oxidoreductase [Sessilibacter corallicola]